MKKVLFLFYITLIALTGCDKQKQTARQIAGTWNLKSYKKTDKEGLSLYATCSGTITFDDCDSKTSCTYSTNYQFAFLDTSGIHKKNGQFEIIEKGDFMNVTILDNSNTTISNLKYRILLRTKTDIILEYKDEQDIYHTLVLEK